MNAQLLVHLKPDCDGVFDSQHLVIVRCKQEPNKGMESTEQNPTFSPPYQFLITPHRFFSIL
jgi:hypothetical protein